MDTATDEALSPDALLVDAVRLTRHPAFSQAVTAYCVGLAKLREAPRLLNAIIATEVRWRIMGYLLYLAADTARFGPQGGATYGRLLDICTRRGEAGPRVLNTMLGLLKLSSLVRVVADARDARTRYYVPTEQLRPFVQLWLGYAVGALDLLEPEMHRSRFLADPAFATRFQVSGGRAHLADPIPLVDRMPEPLASIQPMLGSYSVMVGMMEADLHGQAAPSPARLARRFGLSRSQVMNVQAAGQRAGLFATSDAGDLAVTPALREGFAYWISIELAFYARHMRPPGEPVMQAPGNLV